jgi:hypothetical protein
LYIATGPYIAFWNEFFASFEENFLNECELHYYVFTDCMDVKECENERVHVIFQKPEPWPLPTLLKYHRFLELEDELLKYDYIYQSNANVVCSSHVKSEDFLPRDEYGERLVFTLHPGFYNKKPYTYPYDRNKQSGAYVPYGKEGRYVFGAMNGGISQSYLDFIKIIDKGIIDDLKRNRIALWHDESWVNKMVISRDDCRLLDPGFCYPVGFDVPFERRLSGVPKIDVFDVNTFKGIKETKKLNCLSKLARIIRARAQMAFSFIRFCLGKLFN